MNQSVTRRLNWSSSLLMMTTVGRRLCQSLLSERVARKRSAGFHLRDDDHRFPFRFLFVFQFLSHIFFFYFGEDVFTFHLYYADVPRPLVFSHRFSKRKISSHDIEACVLTEILWLINWSRRLRLVAGLGVRSIGCLCVASKVQKGHFRFS